MNVVLGKGRLFVEGKDMPATRAGAAMLLGQAIQEAQQRNAAIQSMLAIMSDEDVAKVRNLATTTSMTWETAIRHVMDGHANFLTAPGVGRPTGIIGRDAVAHTMDGVTLTGNFTLEPWQRDAFGFAVPNRHDRRKARRKAK